MTARILFVHLAPDEWDNELMMKVRDETFAARPDVDIVHVYEHGGWYLAWNRAGDCVDTANDAARLSDAAYAYLKSITHWQHAGHEFRGKEHAA